MGWAARGQRPPHPCPHPPPTLGSTPVPVPSPSPAWNPGAEEKAGAAHGNTRPGVCPPHRRHPDGCGIPHPEAGRWWGAGRLLVPLPSAPPHWSQTHPREGPLGGLPCRGPPPTCGDAIEEREHPDGLPLLGRHRWVHLRRVLKARGGRQAGRGDVGAVGRGDVGGSGEGGRGGHSQTPGRGCWRRTSGGARASPPAAAAARRRPYGRTCSSSRGLP